MNSETYQFILAVVGPIMVILLGIIGFFLRQQVSVTKTLTDTVNVLNTSVEVLRTNHNHFSTSDIERHKIIDRTLEAHSDKISDHEKRIIKLEK
ncbi:hypothetical protein [uncultured Sunxiuqinia sp.]|uniref:hypothetical protein n=1 Tax=uncultured Sunxiuqinia sp. TaxID=1573825 RepID=UPI00261761F2|nr:hypothetical protein [uncultured Sunxiuqinia sp.]